MVRKTSGKNQTQKTTPKIEKEITAKTKTSATAATATIKNPGKTKLNASVSAESKANLLSRVKRELLKTVIIAIIAMAVGIALAQFIHFK